jgi:hypothetical protein
MPWILVESAARGACTLTLSFCHPLAAKDRCTACNVCADRCWTTVCQQTRVLAQQHDIVALAAAAVHAAPLAAAAVYATAICAGQTSLTT